MTDNLSLVDQATKAAERLEAATKKFNDIVDRQEAIAARMTLGGKSEAGAPAEPKVETAREYKDRVLRGAKNGKIENPQ
jgi:hypothetical protein